MAIPSVGEFVVAKIVRPFAHREAIRNRLLSYVVPNYMEITQDINRARDFTGSSLGRSYDLLDDLIARVSEADTQIIFVALPVKGDSYELDPQLIRRIDSGNSILLDYRRIEGISDASYIDQMHLGAGGAALVTTKIAQDIAAILRSSKNTDSPLDAF